jgi:acetyl esterase
MAELQHQMRKVLLKSSSLIPAFSFSETPIAEIRELYAEERKYWNCGGPQLPAILDTQVKGPVGPVQIRIYHPDPENTLPVLVFLHGGGFVVGSNDTHDRIMRELAFRSGCAVVGVEYSLSPEQKFPVAIEETISVLKWLKHDLPQKENSALNLDPERVVLGGDSAGASLSMGAALSFKNNLRGLLLIYGWFGLRDSCSSRLFGGTEDGLSEENRAFYQDAYLRSPEDLLDPKLDVLGADLRGLPASCLIVSDMDPLLDDSTALAALLEKAEVPYELHLHQGVLHGFLHYSRMLDSSVTALDQGADFLREVFVS